MQSLRFFRANDPARGKALDDALDDLRAGKGRSRSKRDTQYNVWLMDVWVAGLADYDLIIWDELQDDVVIVIHAGRAKL